MKKILLALAVLAIAGDCWAVCTGRFDVSLSAFPTLQRDVMDGRYEAGVAKPLWSLTCDSIVGVSLGRSRRVFMVGPYSTWSVTNGASNIGLFAGPALVDVNAGSVLSSIVSDLNLPETWKPSAYLPVSAAIGWYEGYRIKMDPDLRHRFPGGFLFLLTVPFGAQQIAAGL